MINVLVIVLYRVNPSDLIFFLVAIYVLNEQHIAPRVGTGPSYEHEITSTFRFEFAS